MQINLTILIQAFHLLFTIFILKRLFFSRILSSLNADRAHLENVAEVCVKEEKEIAHTKELSEEMILSFQDRVKCKDMITRRHQVSDIQSVQPQGGESGLSSGIADGVEVVIKKMSDEYS
ncbi:hypothetical protein HOD08_03330 [bacterium]|mgnify:CR=1 FL=1|jgi:hypothetical protein|nr:hypothetical protein [bacterium]